MKNILFFFAFFFPVFLFSQNQGQVPVGGLSYAPDSNYVILSDYYKGRNGVALWQPASNLSNLIAFPATEIPYGTGAGVASNPTFQRVITGNFQDLRIGTTNQFNDIGRFLFYGMTSDTSIYQNFLSNDRIQSGVTSNSSISGTSTKFMRLRMGLGRRTEGTVTIFTQPVQQGDILGSIEFFQRYSSSFGRNGATIYAQAQNNNFSKLIFGYGPTSGAFDTTDTYRAFDINMEDKKIRAYGYGKGTITGTVSTYASFDTNGNLIETTTSPNIYNIDGSLSANRTVTGASNNLDFTGMGNMTATGSGSATYRFNLYPNSSLPVLLEQTSSGDTAFVQLQGSLGRATVRATEDIYLQAVTGLYAQPLEGSSTGIVSTRPDGELVRREESFFNVSLSSDTFELAGSDTEINLPFADDISENFTISGDSVIYAGSDTAYFLIDYQLSGEFAIAAGGSYAANFSIYLNGVKVSRSSASNLTFFAPATTQPIRDTGRNFIVQLVSGDVINIRASGTAATDFAIHNLSFTGSKIN